MAIDFVRNIITSGYNIAKINDNFVKIETALEDAVSRSGTAPNQMNADFDMNSNDILNAKDVFAETLTLDGSLIIPGEISAVQYASQAEAEAATNNTKIMTPLRTKQGIDFYGVDSGVVRFKGPLADEITNTVQSNLAETINVSRWGVKPGNTAAVNTVNMLKAIAANTNAEFVFQGGDYLFNDKLTIPNGSVLYFTGAGPGVTRLVQTDLTKDLLDFDINFAKGGGVRGLTIMADVPFGDRGSSGIGLRVRNANDNFVCRDFEIVSFDKGVRVDASFYPQFSNFRILYFADYGVLVSPYTVPGTVGAGSNFSNGKISNFGFTGDRSASIGIDIQQASGDFYDTIDITVVNIGVKVAPPAGSHARYLFMTKVLADTCDTYGWWFDGSNAPVTANEFSMCWVSYTQGPFGIRIEGANLDDLRWMGGWVRDNWHEGVRLAGGKNVSFLGTAITRNSKAVPNIDSGFCVSANVSDWSVSMCRIGNVSTLDPNSQLHNVLIEPGTSQNFRVIGNDLRDPGVGGLSVNNNSTVENWIVDKNLPLFTPGTNRDTSADFSGVSIGTVATNSTVYLGTVGQQASQLDAYLMVGRTGVATQFVVQVDTAPGASESFTYTVLKNDVATAMTGAISGAGSFQFVSPTSFTVSAADRLSIRLVTSSGAAIARHRWVLNIDS